MSHRITLCFSPAAVVIIEDGIFIVKWDRSVDPYLVPIFNWQIQGASSTLNANFSNILIIPPTFDPTVQSPWDISLTDKWSYPSGIWVVNAMPGNPIPVTYESLYMRASTDSLQKQNASVSTAVAMDLIRPSGIVTYRMRVNESGGSESMITIVGNNILRITNDGNTVLWTQYTNGQYQTLSPSSIVTGSGEFTQVTVVYGLQTISLFEDGVFKYSRSYQLDQEWQATWTLQHYDLDTAVSADLSNVRCLPLAMLYPPVGNYNIYNYKHDSRVVDLSNGNQTGPIVGSALSVPPTQSQEVRVCGLI